MQRDLTLGVSGLSMKKLWEERLSWASAGRHGPQVEGTRASLEDSRVSLREYFLYCQPRPDCLSQLGCGRQGRSLRKHLGVSEVKGIEPPGLLMPRLPQKGQTNTFINIVTGLLLKPWGGHGGWHEERGRNGECSKDSGGPASRCWPHASLCGSKLGLAAYYTAGNFMGRGCTKVLGLLVPVGKLFYPLDLFIHLTKLIHSLNTNSFTKCLAPF